MFSFTSQLLILTSQFLFFVCTYSSVLLLFWRTGCLTNNRGVFFTKLISKMMHYHYCTILLMHYSMLWSILCADNDICTEEGRNIRTTHKLSCITLCIGTGKWIRTHCDQICNTAIKPQGIISVVCTHDPMIHLKMHSMKKLDQSISLQLSPHALFCYWNITVSHTAALTWSAPGPRCPRSAAWSVCPARSPPAARRSPRRRWGRIPVRSGPRWSAESDTTCPPSSPRWRWVGTDRAISPPWLGCSVSAALLVWSVRLCGARASASASKGQERESERETIKAFYHCKNWEWHLSVGFVFAPIISLYLTQKIHVS